MVITKPFPKSWEEVPQIIDIPYVSIMLQIGPETIRKLCAAGDIPAIKVGQAWRIDKSDFRRYLDDCKKHQEEEQLYETT